MLGHRLRRWPNIKKTFGQCFVFSRIAFLVYNIDTMLDQRLRRWTNILSMLYKWYGKTDHNSYFIVFQSLAPRAFLNETLSMSSTGVLKPDLTLLPSGGVLQYRYMKTVV